MSMNEPPLEIYEKLQALVQKDARDIAEQVYKEQATKYGVAEVPLHRHNGLDSPQISETDITPKLAASGSILMATNGQRYTLGAPFNASSVLFYGNAVHKTAGTIDIRAFVVGSAQLKPSFYYQPQSSSSVKTGGPRQNVIQSSSYFLRDDATGTVNTKASEGHLISVEWPSLTVVARATVPNTDGIAQTSKGYGNGFLYLDVELASGWEINGNFVVT